MEQINYYERGLLKAKLEDYEGAIEDYSISIEIDPKYSYILYKNFNVRHKLGNI